MFKTKVLVKKLVRLILFCLIVVPGFIAAEEGGEVRKSKPYPLKPKYTFSGDKDAHCELWSLDRMLGKAATCRRRAKKPSTAPILCRFKRSYMNDDDPTLTMCVYEKAGHNLEDFTISSETYICEKEFKCKR